MRRTALVVVCGLFLAFLVFWNQRDFTATPMTKTVGPVGEQKGLQLKTNSHSTHQDMEAIKDKITAILQKETTNARLQTDEEVKETPQLIKEPTLTSTKETRTKPTFQTPRKNSIQPSPTARLETTSRPALTTPDIKPPKLVIILAQTRSGSSFLGEIFNQRDDVEYFYEPLYPFGGCPRTDSRDLIDYFYSVLRYDFNATRDIYKKAFSIAKRVDNQCQATGVCFSACDKCAAFIYRDAHLCRPTLTNGCQVEDFLNGVSEHAKTVKLLAFKTCYMCDPKWIEPILKNPAYDVKIVHLVRDPRAIIKSKISYAHTPLTIDINEVREMTIKTCQHIETMTKYVDANLAHDENKYFRIRHEDFSLDTIAWTQKIYDFVGLQMTTQIQNWIISATSAKNSKNLSNKNQFGTKRNSAEVVVSWRKLLLFEQIEVVQDNCQYYMMSSSYRAFEDDATVRNLDEPSF